MRATVLLLLGNASWEACTIEFSDLGKGSGVNPKDLTIYDQKRFVLNKIITTTALC